MSTAKEQVTSLSVQNLPVDYIVSALVIQLAIDLFVRHCDFPHPNLPVWGNLDVVVLYNGAKEEMKRDFVVLPEPLDGIVKIGQGTLAVHLFLCKIILLHFYRTSEPQQLLILINLYGGRQRVDAVVSLVGGRQSELQGASRIDFCGQRGIYQHKLPLFRYKDVHAIQEHSINHSDTSRYFTVTMPSPWKSMMLSPE